MSRDFVMPEIPSPLRVILMGAAQQGWFDATDEERPKVITRLDQMMSEWVELGAKPLATIDDDLFMVGAPGNPNFFWYLIYDVPSMEVLAAMVNCLRLRVDGLRLDKYLRIESRIGRPFFPLGGI